MQISDTPVKRANKAQTSDASVMSTAKAECVLETYVNTKVLVVDAEKITTVQADYVCPAYSVATKAQAAYAVTTGTAKAEYAHGMQISEAPVKRANKAQTSDASVMNTAKAECVLETYVNTKVLVVDAEKITTVQADYVCPAYSVATKIQVAYAIVTVTVKAKYAHGMQISEAPVKRANKAQATGASVMITAQTECVEVTCVNKNV